MLFGASAGSSREIAAKFGGGEESFDLGGDFPGVIVLDPDSFY
jgi:hypothetical protein